MKNKVLAITLCISALLLSGCNDGVPKIDDPAKPVVDGKEMTTSEFLEKYCIAKKDNETCMRVLVERGKQSTRRNNYNPNW